MSATSSAPAVPLSTTPATPMPGQGAPGVEWALWLASRGFLVHPLHWPTQTSQTPAEVRCSCGDVGCGKRAGKHPKLPGWQQTATSDETMIRGWWKAWPLANIGIYTGAGDLLVVDEDGQEGKDSRRELEGKLGPFAPTFCVRTGGGAHWYFRKPAGSPKVANRSKLAPGLDVRADGANGGNIVGAGSVHWSGSRYAVADSSDPAAAPPKLLEYVMGPHAPRTVKAVAGAAAPVESEQLKTIPHSVRVTRAIEYLESADAAISHSAGHNTAIRVATAAVRGFALDKTSARQALAAWNARCAPPWSDSELGHKIDDAIRVGQTPWGSKLAAGHGAAFVFRTGSDIAKSAAVPSHLLPHFQIGPGRPTILGGAAGVGKTILAIELLLATAGCWDSAWGGLSLKGGGSVIHLDYEMGEGHIDARYQKIAAGMGLDLGRIEDRLRTASFPHLRLSSARAELERALLAACAETELCVVDSLLAACPDAKSENDATMRAYIDVLTKVSDATGCSMLILAHESKHHGESRRTNRLRGSSAINDAAGSVLSVTQHRDGLRIEQPKAPHGRPGAAVHLRFTDGAPAGAFRGTPLSIEAAAPSTKSAASPPAVGGLARAKGDILAALGSGALNVGKLKDQVVGRNESKDEALNQLLAEGVVTEKRGARNSRVIALAVRPSTSGVVSGTVVGQ